jgi:hypothetical protein
MQDRILYFLATVGGGKLGLHPVQTWKYSNDNGKVEITFLFENQSIFL